MANIYKVVTIGCSIVPILGNGEMSLRVWAAVVALAMTLGGECLAAPLEAYARLPALDDISISPDGTKLAFVQSSGTKRATVILNLEDHRLLGRIDLNNEKLQSQWWADNAHLLLVTHVTARGGIAIAGSKHEYFLVQSYDLNTRKSQDLLQDPRNVGLTMNAAFGQPKVRTVNGHTVVFIPGIYFPPVFQSTDSRIALYAADLTTGVTRLVEHESPYAQEWIIDSAGEIVAETDYNETKQHWGLMLKRNGHWAEAYGVAASVELPSAEGIADDDSAVIVRTAAPSEFHTIALADGRINSPERPERNLGTVLTDLATDRIIGGVQGTMEAEYVFFSSADRSAWSRIVAANPDASVEPVSWSKDRNKIVIRVSGHLDGDVYKLVDMTARRLDVIGTAYEGIGPQDYAAVKVIFYPAADGRRIAAYLTMPKGGSSTDLPLVVLPHGGPAARDVPGFDWWAQALASRGYAVLQPQFRGSDGFGWDLLSAGFGEWGGKMQTDLSDGIRYLSSLAACRTRPVA